MVEFTIMTLLSVVASISTRVFVISLNREPSWKIEFENIRLPRSVLVQSDA